MSKNSDKKENLLNIVFALTIRDDKDKEQFLKLSDIQDLVSKLNSVAEHYPFLHQYDLPDLNPKNLKKNKHVDYVGLDNEIAYHMKEKEAHKIIEENMDLVHLISNFATAETFNDDIRKLTNDVIVFDCHNPNTVYELGYVDDGQAVKENKLLTDGKINILEKTENYKKVKIDGATYVIQAAYEDERLKAAVVKTHFVHPGLLEFLKYEVKDFYEEKLQNSYDESEKPSVYRKRLN